MSGNSGDAQDPNKDYSEVGQNFPYISDEDAFKSQDQSDLLWQSTSFDHNWKPDLSFTYALPPFVTEATDLIATNYSVLPSSAMTWPEAQFSDASNHQDNDSTNPREDTSNSAAKLTPERFPCPTCGRRFKKKHDLERHIDVHENKKPYGCDHCRARFARPYDLKVSILSGILFSQMSRSIYWSYTLTKTRSPSPSQIRPYSTPADDGEGFE